MMQTVKLSPPRRTHSISFMAELVWGVFSGLKTETRRLVKWSGLNSFERDGIIYQAQMSARGYATDVNREPVAWTPKTLDWLVVPQCPYGKIGDRLYIREPFRVVDGKVQYRAGLGANGYMSYSGDKDISLVEWRAARFMKKAYTRATIELEQIGVERLQDIDEAGAGREGVRRFFNVYHWMELRRNDFNVIQRYKSRRDAFIALWDSINTTPEARFEANPYVWRLRFKIVDGPCSGEKMKWIA